MNLRRYALFACLAAVFFGYAYSLLSIRQYETASFAPETDCIGAGVSFSHYGTRIGTIGEEVFSTIRTANVPFRELITKVVTENKPLTHIKPRANDGNGIGCPIFSSLSMGLFGTNLKALNLGVIALIGLSLIGFATRFPDRRLLAPAITLLAITIMLLTPLTTNETYAGQISIGGLRYFIIVALIPAMHLFFEVFEKQTLTRKTKALIFLQMLILVLAIFVRSTPSYLMWPVWAFLIYTWLSTKQQIPKKAALKRLGGFAGLFLGLHLFYTFSMPLAYVSAGQITGGIWQRVIGSFSLHPEWPFPGLHDQYDCTRVFDVGLSVQSGPDRNNHCLWLGIAENQKRPLNEVNNELYSRAYESGLRGVFFDVLHQYPQKTLELFFYYKPIKLLPMLQEAYQFNTNAPREKIPGMLALQCAAILGIAFFATSTSRRSVAIVFPLLIVAYFCCGMVPQMLAWSTLPTSVDIIFYSFALVLSAVIFPLDAIIRKLTKKKA